MTESPGLYPPKLFLRFFRWYCHPRLADHIEGDLIEVYRKRVLKNGKRKADIRFIIDVLLLFRPGIIRPVEGYKNLNNYGMYKSYLKIGWRNLLKNKGYSFINIGGLSVGMTVAMLIGLWIYDELSFDRYHQKYNRIARVIRNGTANGETMSNTFLPYALGDELKTKYGGNFKQVVMASPLGDHILSVDDKRLSQKGEFIEAGAPKMFTFKMVKGSLDGLKDPHSIFLSESLAKNLFGDTDPMEKQLKIDNKMDVKVTGVYEDLPHNTHFHEAKFFAPWDLLVSHNQWMLNHGFKVNFLDIYVEIQPETDFEKASASIKDAILNNIRDDQSYVDINPQIFLHPMSNWHLLSEFKNGVAAGGLIQFVWLFGTIGAFVLLLACINFMNLSTARSERRAKEVGIRKAMGSVRGQLVNQFFSESFLVVSLAFILSVLVVAASLNWFNGLAGKQMTMLWMSPYFWFTSLGFILFTGFLAGSYPAIYLSSFQPVKVLKGIFRVGRFASIPRKVLVVVQFTVSVTLIIGTIIVYQQIQFAKNRPVGYTRDGLLMMQITTPDFYGKIDALRNELKNTGVVDVMALSNGPITALSSSGGGFTWKGKDPNLQTEFATLSVTHDYGKTVGWQFVAGRDFSRDFASDSSGFVITEGAAKIMNLQNPIGETVRWEPGWRKSDNFKIIGIVKDMVMESPFETPMPTIFFIDASFNWINIKINPTMSASEALPTIESIFKKLIPSVPFDYKFVSQEYALKFAAEERIGKLSSVFAVLAILISCLGLFGLASFVAEQRTKEIGIRKVVGASVFNLWKMLSKDFVVLVVISCLIAIPIAYYFLAEWLKRYEYRTEISWWIFAVTSLAALVITLLTVSYQAVKAALMKPVNSLRSE